MDNTFIGREAEIQQLQDIYNSGRAEFVTVYGRRRVGKTCLIQHFFNGCFSFSTTGIIGGSKSEQMYSFTSALIHAGYAGGRPRSWLEAFDALKTVVDQQPTAKRHVIYIDELPCFDTPKSGFVNALGYFWNTWASLRSDVVLIVCGSATSWMIEHIIDNHGGLHNRSTHTIYLRQFHLAETEAYLKSRGINWTRQMVTEAYMMLGGIPYYLGLLSRRESLAQNIDRIYFHRNGELRLEYRRLYASLFNSPEPYVRIVELLGKNKRGMTRKEIATALNVSSSGTLSRQLENLEYCDIIRRYVTKRKGKMKNNDAYYQLIDLFTFFHLSFSQKLTTSDYWEQHLNTPVVNTWLGLAFERVCMVHIDQVRQALGISRIGVEYYSWRSTTPPHAQIDMIIERADHFIHLCEMKYTNSEYSISAEDDRKMRDCAEAFVRETHSRCGILPTWITSYGLHANMYSVEVTERVVLDDLFYRIL